jgi:predicted Zn-dependent protease
MQLLEKYHHGEFEYESYNQDIPNFLIAHPTTYERILITKEFKAKLKEL